MEMPLDRLQSSVTVSEYWPFDRQSHMVWDAWSAVMDPDATTAPVVRFVMEKSQPSAHADDAES